MVKRVFRVIYTQRKNPDNYDVERKRVMWILFPPTFSIYPTYVLYRRWRQTRKITIIYKTYTSATDYILFIFIANRINQIIKETCAVINKFTLDGKMHIRAYCKYKCSYLQYFSLSINTPTNRLNNPVSLQHTRTCNRTCYCSANRYLTLLK